jgi:hypothetical protein
MPGGRPSAGANDSYPELAELAAWLREAILDSGYSSVNAFVVQHALLDKNKIYGVVNGTQFLQLSSMRELARALQRDPSELERIWLRAKEAMERRLTASDDERPRLTAWAEIPLPEPALRNLLDGLADAVEQLPYRLLRVRQPPLSTVYVRQKLRQGSTSGDAQKGRERQEARPEHGESASADLPVSVAEALNRNEHLVITGEPGAGKSTLGHHLISRLARIWLRQESAVDSPLAEPVVPVRISARALATDDTWGSVLAEATRRALGPYLITEPSPQLFIRRVQGARWLIVVDGLDEILDRSTRASIIRALGRHARAGGDYRFVITTRPLPEEELAPLQAGHIGHCRIEPFEHDDLRIFAERWFTAQDPITADRRAAEFLEQVEDARLRELVRNPLLATIAAVASTREPDRPLPVNRVDLYQRFYDYLVTDDDASGRVTLEELRRFRESHPARYKLSEWVLAQRVILIDAMANERLSSEAPLLETACEWVRARKPADAELPPGWEEDLERLLIDTGMFVYESTGLRFLHHTFAEFLAARICSAEIRADFPELEDWITRGLNEAQRDFVLLTFVLWGRRGKNDIGLVLRPLMEGGPERVLFAGRLLAESGDIPDSDSMTFIDRLIDLALGNLAKDPGNSIANTPFDDSIVEILSGLRNNSYASMRIREIIRQGYLPNVTRILACVFLGLVGESEEAISTLIEIARKTVMNKEIILVAAGIHELNPDDVTRVLPLLLSVSQDSNADAELKIKAAEALSEIGEEEAAIEVARSVLSDITADESDLAAATWILLERTDSATSEDLTTILGQSSLRSPSYRAAIAEEFADSARADIAISMARSILTDPASNEDDVATAAEIWLSTAEDAPIEEILTTLANHPASSPWTYVRIAETLATSGHKERAISIAHDVLADPASDNYDVTRAVEVWLSAAGERAVSEILGSLGQHPTAGPAIRIRIAETLATAGQTTRAVNMARDVLNARNATPADVTAALEAWISVAEPGAADEILAAFERKPTVGSGHRAAFASKLAELGHYQAASSQAILVLGDPQTSTSDIAEAVQTLVKAQGLKSAQEIRVLLKTRRAPFDHHLAAADSLAVSGALSSSIELWTELLMIPRNLLTDRLEVLNRLVNTGQRQHAIEMLQAALLATNRQQDEYVYLRALLAWATLSDPEAATCGFCTARTSAHPASEP